MPNTPQRLLGSQLLAGGVKEAVLPHRSHAQQGAQPPRGEYVSVGRTVVPPVSWPLPPFPGMVAAEARAGDAAGLGKEAGAVHGPPLPVPSPSAGAGMETAHREQQSEASR